MRRIFPASACGWLLLAAGPLCAAEGTSGAPVVSRGEEWLGEGSDLGLELAHVIAAGKKGNPGQALRDLELITAEAEARGLKEVWLQSQQAWVRFTLVAQPESDLTPAVEQLLGKARNWGMAAEEAEVFALWGEVLKSQGQWLMALKAQDRVTQLTLDQGRVSRAVEAFLDMARLCRAARHDWRLRQVWTRLDQVLATRQVSLPDDLIGQVDLERATDAAVLARGRGAVTEGVDLQPKDSRVLVSATAGELGRSRFLLTNTTAFSVEGTLSVTAGLATVSAWQRGELGWYVTLSKGGQAEGIRSVRLLPGQQLEVYVEHDPGVSEDRVQVQFTGGNRGSVSASGTFYFADGQPVSSLVNAGVFQLNEGWTIPLYHEIYHRGARAQVQNLQVNASAACRLEIYDHDTGRLLAVDANGDGAYGHPGDQVIEDADRDGWPDLVVGDRARAIEICAWPLGVTGAGLTVRAGLRAPAGGESGAQEVENTLHAPAVGQARP
jgi:hypothetical protein